MAGPTAHRSERRPTVAVPGTGLVGAAMARSLLRAGRPCGRGTAPARGPSPCGPTGPVSRTRRRTPSTGADVVLTVLDDDPGCRPR